MSKERLSVKLGLQFLKHRRLKLCDFLKLAVNKSLSYLENLVVFNNTAYNTRNNNISLRNFKHNSIIS